MAGLVRITDHAGDGSQQQRLESEQPDIGNEHRLDGKQDLQHQHERCKQGDQIGTGFGKGGVHDYRNKQVDTSASVPRMKAAAIRSGTRNRRSFALVVSTSTTAPARMMSFPISQTSPRPNAALVALAARPNGKNMFANSVISTSCLMDALHSMSAR